MLLCCWYHRSAVLLTCLNSSSLIAICTSSALLSQLMRYRQLVAQKNAERALASNAAARKQPFYANNGNNEGDTTSASPPITATQYPTKTPALLSRQYTPAVSDGSSSGSSSNSNSNSSSISSQLSSEASAGEEEDSTTYGHGHGHGISGDGRYNLLSELDAENESSRLLSSSTSAGRSNKENVTPSPSTLTAGSLDTVDKILGGMSTTATAAAMSVGSSSRKKKVQTVNLHPYGGVGGGKKYMVSKKALRLEGQWAMVGEAQTDGDDTSSSSSSSSSSISSSSESGSSTSSSISSTSNQGEDGVINASTNVVQGTPASRVNQDPGELLSTTGVSFLEDVSCLDEEGEEGGVRFNLDNHNALLSPVAEDDGTTTEVAAGTTTPAAATITTNYAEQIYTFTPGSASPASMGMFDEQNSEWKDASVETARTDEAAEKLSRGEGNGDISAATTTPLKDASMWVLPPEEDSSNDTISNAPSDETDGSIHQNPPGAADFCEGANKRQMLGELSIGEYEESLDDSNEIDEDDRFVTLSPNRCLRTNAIDQALEETTLYMNKIKALESALHKAERSAEVEAQKRRNCEKRIDELVMQKDQDQPIAAQTPAGIATLDMLNFSAFISPHAQDVEAEEMAQVEVEVNDKQAQEDVSEQDLSTESSELLDARAATASLMERNQTLVKEIRFADQTCVELSERNASLERDVERLGKELDSSRTAQEDLRERLEKSTMYAAKLEERTLASNEQLSHQQSLFDAKMAATETELATARLQISSLQSKVDTLKEEKLSLNADVASANSKVKAIESSRASQAAMVATPPEVDIEEYDRTRDERDALANKCGELEAQIALLSRSIEEKEKVKTPQKIILTTSDTENNAASTRTPTSTVLAKTLQSQLERGNSVEDRARDAEKAIVALQMQLEASRAETVAAKEEARALRDAQRQKQMESDADASAEYEGEEEYETDTSADCSEEDSAYVVDASASMEEEPEKEKSDAASLRSQLHEALYDKKALLIEVSTCKASIQALEEQLSDAKTSSQTVSIAEAEEKIKLQQQQIEKLTKDLSNLQTRIDMEREASSMATPSLASELTSSPAGESKDAISALSDTDAAAMAMDATFSTGRLERCEEGWATPAAKKVDNVDKINLKSQLDECQMQLKLSLAELEAARSEAADMLNNLEEEKDILIEDNELLAVEIEETKAALQMEQANAKEAAEAAEIEFRRISGELALAKASNAEIDCFRSSIDVASKQIAALENDVLNANAQIEVKDIEIAALTRRCEEQGDAIEQYRSLRLEDAKTVEDLRDALQESSTQAESLKQSLVDCNEKLASEIEQKMEMEEASSQLRSQLASIKNQSQTVAADKDATIRELTTSNQRSRTSLENELEQALQERDQLAKEAEKAISALQREIGVAASSMRNLATSLDINDVSSHASPNSVQQRRSHFTFSLRPHAQDRGGDSSLASAHTALAQLKATIDAVRQKVEERDAFAFEMEVKNKRLTADVSKTSKDAEESKTKQREMEVLLKKATQELQSHITKLSLAESDLQQSRDSVVALESACEQLKVERDSAISKLSEKEISLVDTLVRQREDSSSALKALREKLAIAEEERKRFATTNEALTKKCSRLREYVKSLTVKCEEWSDSYRKQSTEVIATKKENMDLTQKVSQMRSFVDDCPELDPSCTSCVQLRSVIEAQTQVRAALLHSG